MGNPKIAIVAYCLAVGFILVVALHSSSKTLITASVTALMPVADLKCESSWLCSSLSQSFTSGTSSTTTARYRMA